jgi:hypothetical protein
MTVIDPVCGMSIEEKEAVATHDFDCKRGALGKPCGSNRSK